MDFHHLVIWDKIKVDELEDIEPFWSRISTEFQEGTIFTFFVDFRGCQIPLLKAENDLTEKIERRNSRLGELFG